MATSYVARSLRSATAQSVSALLRHPAPPCGQFSPHLPTSVPNFTTFRRGSQPDAFRLDGLRLLSTIRTLTGQTDRRRRRYCSMGVILSTGLWSWRSHEIIDGYIKTLAMLVGSEEEARMKIYSVSTRHYFAFGALVSEELSYKLKELPKVRWVLPDSYLDVRNKDYGGEPFINGQAVPYDPKYHEEWVRNNARANERNRRNDRPRNFDRSRNFERQRDMQMSNHSPITNVGGPAAGGQPHFTGGPPNYGGCVSLPIGGQPNFGGGTSLPNFGGQPNYRRSTPPPNIGGQPNYGGGGPPPNIGGQPNYCCGGPPHSIGRGGGIPPSNRGSFPLNNMRGMADNAPASQYGVQRTMEECHINLVQDHFTTLLLIQDLVLDKMPDVGYSAGQNQNFAPNMRPPCLGQHQNSFTPSMGGGNLYENHNLPGRDLPPRTNY
ncbi:hypothetical protein F511_37461 [Dorcoceras hygrometricum]|uniref:MORF/ORRM1/DAG-like MORF domain-containing protein n=1 Tax=Dorcoceras hygrometricum TaxID=472368 RepID=A0A2Z7CQS4_9LAMI|nr:hypothetical protein F511_37461 [Dorcoceras hygrometricum]